MLKKIKSLASAKVAAITAVLLGMLFVPEAMAQTSLTDIEGGTLDTGGGEAFKGVYQMIEGWLTGWLGKTIAIVAVLSGAMMSIGGRQGAMPFLIAIAIASVIVLAPSILSTIFGVVI